MRVLAPVLLAGAALAAVLEAIRVRGEIGPSLSWFEEFVRYYYLMIPTVDGSLSRRLPVLLVLLCLAAAIAAAQSSSSDSLVMTGGTPSAGSVSTGSGAGASAASSVTGSSLTGGAPGEP